MAKKIQFEIPLDVKDFVATNLPSASTATGMLQNAEAGARAMLVEPPPEPGSKYYAAARGARLRAANVFSLVRLLVKTLKSDRDRVIAASAFFIGASFEAMGARDAIIAENKGRRIKAKGAHGRAALQEYNAKGKRELERLVSEYSKMRREGRAKPVTRELCETMVSDNVKKKDRIGWRGLYDALKKEFPK